jgi:hypothetical protein
VKGTFKMAYHQRVINKFLGNEETRLAKLHKDFRHSLMKTLIPFG